MKAAIVFLAGLLIAMIATGASAASPPAPLLLTGARVLDPSGDRLLDGRDVLIEGGRISRIAAAGTIEAPPGTQRLDLAGLTLIPGLIDLHSHLLLHPYDETSWDDQVLREPLELRTIRGVVASKATLEAGFTTLRDLGTEGAGFADVALRDAIASGMIPYHYTHLVWGGPGGSAPCGRRHVATGFNPWLQRLDFISSPGRSKGGRRNRTATPSTTASAAFRPRPCQRP